MATILVDACRSVIAQLGGDLERIKRDLLDRKRRQAAAITAAGGHHYRNGRVPPQQLLSAPVPIHHSSLQAPVHAALPSRPLMHQQPLEQPAAEPAALQGVFDPSHAAVLSELSTAGAVHVQPAIQPVASSIPPRASPLKRGATMPPMHTLMGNEPLAVAATAVPPPAMCEQDPFHSLFLESPMGSPGDERDIKRSRTCT
jgi:hypothetical protein